MKELETMSIKDLQAELVANGMPEDDAVTFKTKASAIATLRTIMASKAVEEAPQEVKKVASIEEKPNPAEDREVNRRWLSKAHAMKKHLEAQEKVSILIPLDPTERQGVVEWRTGAKGETYQVHVGGAIESVQLNGYKYFIPKGVYTQVPRQIAEVISRSQQQTLDAGKHVSLDRIDEKTGRPVSEVL